MSGVSSTRVLVITPRLDGADGISEVSRQAIDACAGAFGRANVEAWALDGGAAGPASVRFRSADGRRGRLAGWAIARASRRVDDLLVLVLHVHLAPVALPLVVRGATLACFFHGVEVWRPLRTRERAAVAAASILMANSRWTAERFKAANPALAGRAVAVCALGAGRPAAPPVLPSDRGYALIVGRMSSADRYKGHEQLITCWRDVVARVAGARLVLVGEGDDRPRLEALAAARGVSGHVVFTGRASDPERDGYYRNAAFFVMPSTGEGFGLTYLEAMIAGKPCIAAAGAAAEIIEDGITGFVVDPASPGALTTAIVTLFDDPALCGRMGTAAASRAAESFQTRHFADRLIEALLPSPAFRA